MPRRVSPYGSADDAEATALARGRPATGGELAAALTARDVASEAAAAIRVLNELTSDGGDMAGLDDVREVVASLQRMSQDLPHLCEHLARMLVVQREERRITAGADQDPDFWVAEAVESLAAAGQAADMLAAALTQAGRTSAELRSSLSGPVIRRSPAGPMKGEEQQLLASRPRHPHHVTPFPPG